MISAVYNLYKNIKNMNKKRPGSFNFYKKYNPLKGCIVCENAEYGVCSLKNRDIPVTCISQNKHPAWCPILKKST